MSKLYEHKSLKLGFVVLCPTCDVWQLTTTIKSLRHNYPGSKVIGTVPDGWEGVQPDDVPLIKGGNTISTLMSIGLENAPCEEWNFVVIAGSWVRPQIAAKFSYFIENDKDVLFPVLDRRMDFITGSINGLLLRKDLYKEVGPFDRGESLEYSKALWAEKAIRKGCHFKGVLGLTVC